MVKAATQADIRALYDSAFELLEKLDAASATIAAAHMAMVVDVLERSALMQEPCESDSQAMLEIDIASPVRSLEARDSMARRRMPE